MSALSSFAVLVWNTPSQSWEIWSDGYDTYSAANRDAADLCNSGRHAIVRRSPVVFPAAQVAA
ncbi:exported hypothetical protein [uncultured Stenotrophomonas sp.]|uniref:Uncharacterized protein n=1 Tax=uncultured Stenotrophomonas sp. TaxID=165438 RepID=A0A1Y5Q7X8_9GAMM|nr:exported hypothetical protein [uncultured Stenotrophomonas sp.]